MTPLDRRVPVLFAEDQYESLARCAEAEGRSIGSLVREAVEQSLAQRQPDRRAAVTRFLARSDEATNPPLTLEQWRAEKQASHSSVTLEAAG